MTNSCYRCNGTGMYLGNGMMMAECNICDDNEPQIKMSAPPLKSIDRRSKDYIEAINDIMKTSQVSRSEAKKIFDEAYENS